MTTYGFFSRQQACLGGTSLYLTPTGDKVEISEVITTMPREEAIASYAKRWLGGSFIGEVTEWVGKPHRGCEAVSFIPRSTMYSVYTPPKKYGSYSLSLDQKYGHVYFRHVDGQAVKVTEVIAKKSEADARSEFELDRPDAEFVGEVTDLLGDTPDAAPKVPKRSTDDPILATIKHALAMAIVTAGHEGDTGLCYDENDQKIYRYPEEGSVMEEVD